MAVITAFHESLPYIDSEPTPAERAAAEAVITQERALVPDDPFHALLPVLTPDSPFETPLLREALSAAASGTHLAALDMTRYQDLHVPDLARLSSDEARETLSAALSRAYALHTYVAGRRAHLALLDSYGKNAWLVGNWHLEGELKKAESELAIVRREIDVVTLQRRQAQQGTGAEMQTLEDTWRKSIASVLETEAATENLRRQALEARRFR